MIETARGALQFVRENRNRIGSVQYADTATMVHIIIVNTRGACLGEGFLDPGEFVRFRNEAEVEFVRSSL